MSGWFGLIYSLPNLMWSGVVCSGDSGLILSDIWPMYYCLTSSCLGHASDLLDVDHCNKQKSKKWSPNYIISAWSAYVMVLCPITPGCRLLKGIRGINRERLCTFRDRICIKEQVKTVISND